MLFRLENGRGTDGFVIAGLIIMVCGLALETAADLQKSAAKKVNPGRFVDTGLYRLVRCPNYLGIIYVMFGGARRLEMRQNRTYGSDPEYRKYVKTTPIMIPFIPLYSVEKYKWLVA